MSSANYLSDFIKQTPSSEDTNQSATQILHFCFGNYRFITVHNSPLRDSIQTRVSSIQNFPSYSSQIHFNIILPSMPMSSKRSSPFMLCDLYCLHYIPYTSQSLRNVCWRVKLMKLCYFKSTDSCSELLWILLWLTAFSGSFSMRSQSTDGPSSCKKRWNSCANPSRSFFTDGCLASGTVPSNLSSSCCSWICASRFVSSLNSREPDGALWCPRTCNNKSYT
jgi:hypothetical protein